MGHRLILRHASAAYPDASHGFTLYLQGKAAAENNQLIVCNVNAEGAAPYLGYLAEFRGGLAKHRSGIGFFGRDLQAEKNGVPKALEQSQVAVFVGNGKTYPPPPAAGIFAWRSGPAPRKFLRLK
jgi:hypothetical protein